MAPVVTIRTRLDGSATADVQDMDGLLQDAWHPMNSPYVEAAELHLGGYLHALAVVCANASVPMASIGTHAPVCTRVAA